MSKNIPLRPPHELFTDNQWQAIFDEGQNILVSASAGSGKTTVLVRRVIEKIKSGTDIDRLLVVTYTEAAAREMKERIQAELQKALTQETDPQQKQHFVRQLSLLPTASISTLHSFCLSVIRRFYYLIDMDPVFRLLTDETEMLLLKEDVWDDLRERLYEQEEESFYQLTSNFSNDRTDDGLTNLVFSLYEFAKANPDPEEWLIDLPKSYQIDGDIGESSLYQDTLKPPAIESLQMTIDRYEKMLELSVGQEKMEKVAALAQKELDWTKQFCQRLSDNELEAAYQLTEVLGFDRFPTVRVPELKEVMEQIKALREQNKKTLKEITASLFTLAPKKMKEIMDQAAVVVRNMAEVGKQFMTDYGNEKLRKGLVDFNDLEHFTLAILSNREGSEWLPTEASTYFRSKFDEVLVDEYQDINRLQESILFWLRRPENNEGNLFMVGDVKQSIYSFRLADPSLFIEKYTRYGQQEDGKRIVLAENFRSRSNVLDFTNLVFEQLMDERVGQIPYDKDAQLVNGFHQFLEADDYTTEVLIYEKKKSQEVEDGFLLDPELQIEDKTEGELHMTALKIRELIDRGYLIYDKKLKESRPVRYQDIVLLTPTKKNNLTILDIFKRFDIPLQVNDAQNYFQATEIRTMISLLQLIDNPYQDIPLAAVLRSPMVGLKETELVNVRLAKKEGLYYEAFLAFNKQTKPSNNVQKTIDKTRAFADQLELWRELARRVSLSELIWKIYQDTAYLDYVGGMPAGQQRQANLYALVDRAANYEKTSFRGLFQFIRFIEKMQEKDKDLAEPVILEDENAVRVMTIHASKGLEFPVVFLLDMTKEFNLSDLKERCIFDDRLGAGIRFLEEETRILYDTLPYLALKQIKMNKLLSEEMRKLYVGLTRAEQKLILIGSYNDREAAWKEWGKAKDVETLVLPQESRLQGKSSLMNWIGMTLIRHNDAEKFNDFYQASKVTELQNHPGRFTISFMDDQQMETGFSMLQQSADIETAPVQSSEKEDQVLLTRGLKRLNFDYPYQLAAQTTNYQSVSEIKRIFEDPDDRSIGKLEIGDSQARSTQGIVHRMASQELSRPSFLQEVQQPAAVEIGTATHHLLQLIDLSKEPTLESLQALLDELVSQKLIAEKTGSRIDLTKILDFFQSELGRMLLAHPDRVRREQPFSMLLDAEEIIKDYPEKSDDELLIHGIIDGYIELDEECILFDYKTDYIRNVNDPSELEKIVKRYRGQLKLYKQALSLTIDKPVTHVYMVLLLAEIIIDMVTGEMIPIKK
ncbi:helicase-exonuclease AddAB subunit AddA [Candidatus Enterococcus clewellii]|uniref:ATP-dependent helicase/nuclease subunit A n=1 Tax=Candidatus Enterococcus clewellii TaxID=1834193 RepID=A0A242KCV6_9ENTE|nr:helicase-exonuclease AddAB subunit AddA [Enterococcus sp. 9E7_DIV0242]OTP19003.1 helicase-exonuclease AddAB, AddA subunit [Enterococcus sp. 9E7_DIV0242]